MPRRQNQKPEAEAPPGGWRVLDETHPDAWPLACVFDLECVDSDTQNTADSPSYTLWDLWIDVSGQGDL